MAFSSRVVWAERSQQYKAVIISCLFHIPRKSIRYETQPLTSISYFCCDFGHLISIFSCAIVGWWFYSAWGALLVTEIFEPPFKSVISAHQVKTSFPLLLPGTSVSLRSYIPLSYMQWRQEVFDSREASVPLSDTHARQDFRPIWSTTALSRVRRTRQQAGDRSEIPRGIACPGHYSDISAYR